MIGFRLELRYPKIEESNTFPQSFYLTNPSNPFDGIITLLSHYEEIRCGVACWNEHEHHGKRDPADREGSHDDGHHNRDSTKWSKMKIIGK